jgi:integrase
VRSVKKAWMTAVLRAHGHTPIWERAKKNHLSAGSRAAYREINLRFHDLRREFGSRVLESGSSLVEARDLLGHANISQTSTYLQSSAKSLALAIEKKEAHEQRLDAARRAAATENSDNTPTAGDRGGVIEEGSDAPQVVKH